MLNFLWTRQIITEVLFIFDVAFAFILIRYLIVKRKDLNGSYWRNKNVHAACALLTVLGVGHSILRGWSIYVFVMLSRGVPLFTLENKTPIGLIGTGISVLGMCWIIRCFSPVQWKERGWIFTMLAAGVFVFIMSFIS